MNKRKAFAALLVCLFAATAGCAAAKPEYDWTNEALDYAKTSELYGGFYSYPDTFSEDFSDEEMLSSDGAEYFSTAYDEQMRENAIDPDNPDSYGVFDIVMDDVRIYPADGGLYALYGFRISGGQSAVWYDIHYVSEDGDSIIYSGFHPQSDIHAVSNGESLFLLWNEGELSSMDSAGGVSLLYSIPNGADISGIQSSLYGDGDRLTAEIMYSSSDTASVVYSLTDNTVVS